ncbi:MAG: mechanosensitive ion channel [Alphaproteobacteria bacterium]|nr:mechanosensitive ion channel [Alphaproteobacteria bacterium]
MEFVEQLKDLLTQYGPPFVAGIAILVIGSWVASFVQHGIATALEKVGKVELTLARFLASLARYLVLTVVVLAALSQFGVQTASLVAIFGAAGLAVGLALQGTLANVAAGVMLLAFRPYRVGDRIEAAGTAGKVEAIDLFVTDIRTDDNIQVLVPNGKIWGDKVTNHSKYQMKRLDFEIAVPDSADVEAACTKVVTIAAGDPRALKSPAPEAIIAKYSGDGVTLALRVWVSPADEGAMRSSMNLALRNLTKNAFA